MRKCFSLLFLFLVLGLHSYEPREGVKNETPVELKDIGIFEKPGERLDLSLEFIDREGQKAPLSKYITGKKPVLLALIYYKCPNLCNFQLNGLTEALKSMDWTVGDQFDLVAISIDPTETPELAKEKRLAYLTEYARPVPETSWVFLVGSQENITKVSGQVGFKFRWNQETEQWAHAAATYVLTPEGKLSRYLYGVIYNAKTLKLSLVEATDGKIGDVIDKFTLFCFQFDPTKNVYTLYAYNFMRLGAGITILFIGIFLSIFWIQNRKKIVKENL
jgi:protein SCO1